MTEVVERDRLKSPSINFPRTREEAFAAVRRNFFKALTDPNHFLMAGSLTRKYMTEAGMGTTRTQEQADWLNEAQDTYRARLLWALDQGSQNGR